VINKEGLKDEVTSLKDMLLEDGSKELYHGVVIFLTFLDDWINDQPETVNCDRCGVVFDVNKVHRPDPEESISECPVCNNLQGLV
jgi:hypothetical protein